MSIQAIVMKKMREFWLLFWKIKYYAFMIIDAFTDHSSPELYNEELVVTKIPDDISRDDNVIKF